MVERVRAGVGLREVAREFRVSLSVVQRWTARAAGQRLDRVDWTSKPTRAARINVAADEEGPAEPSERGR